MLSFTKWSPVRNRRGTLQESDSCLQAGPLQAFCPHGTKSLQAVWNGIRKTDSVLPEKAVALLEPANLLQGASTKIAVSSRKWLGFVLAFLALLLITAVLAGGRILYSRVHPLPEKRFVALMIWPAPVNQTYLPLLTICVDAIESRLARAEASTKELALISSSDNPERTPFNGPAEAARALGANLVLAANLQPEGDGFRFGLSLLDAATSNTLRETHLHVANSRLSQLAELAESSSADLLDVRLPKGPLKDQDEVKSLSAADYRLFAEAEDLFNQPNDVGLDGAVEKYQKVVESNARFALGYAKLALAYDRRYLRTRVRAFLDVARSNVDAALRINPESINALLSRATVDLHVGKTDDALAEIQRALELDPGNPQVLLVKARTLRTLNKGKEEEAVYREVIRNRPNFWPAYDQLGLNLYRQANYEQAAETFEEGTVIAPRVVRLLNNLGAMQMQLKQPEKAAVTYRRSIELKPTAPAYVNLGTLAFQSGDFQRALGYYKNALQVNSRDDLTWRNIADTYAKLGDTNKVLENYSEAARIVSENLKINPRPGDQWMTLAFYEAKLGKHRESEDALREAEERGASAVPAQLQKVETLVLLARDEEAMHLLLELLKKGLSLEDVELALDLAELRRDPRYVQAVAGLKK